ncbi:acyloxyacyl hydrolase [Comamonas sp. NLF-1-9]|uniref:acyloxyacyl hydrolase n=1 Tax=Comamonas sp. NLF-1-9 TaxID=2853163 RepID=UPI001C47542C|nr:acyloxyacyl hydrolase [Comamonas sp. NLF-1-9]QXL83874.1 acyloxyacyl hydrolase [Comamonas sp. NLF-1-9]
MPLLRFFPAALVALLAAGAAAQPLDAQATFYLQGSASSGGTHLLTLGTTLPWKTSGWQLASGTLSGHWDAYASRWNYRGVRHSGLWLLGLTPVLRWTPDAGQAPWFVQAGIGITLMDHLYRKPGKAFSTAFNFASHLGVGLRFGEQRQQEVMLSVQHISNARIKRPNPGINLVQLRYALHW